MKIKKYDFKDIFPYLGLVAVIIFFQAMTGVVFTAQNLKALLSDGFYTIIGAVGYIFIIAQGNLDFSLGGTMGVSCAMAGLASLINPYLALPAALLTGLVIGCVNGFMVAKLHLDSFIATMAFNYCLKGAVVLILAGGIVAAPAQMISWNNSALKAIVALLVVLIGWVVFNYTSYGKECRAIGAQQEAAYQSGVKVEKVKFIAFVTMAVIGGLLGFFSLVRTGTASSKTGSTFLTQAWNAVLLGGVPVDGGMTTKFRGALIGSLTMTFLTNGMTLMGVGSYTKQLINGIIFITVIAISFNRKNITEIN